MHKLGVRILARVRRVKASLVGQDNQHIGFNQIGDQSTQRVVVTELDFVVDDRIVFVDDRHNAQLEQSQQGGPCVEVTLPIRQVGMCQKHLGAAKAVFAQLGFIHLGQAHLPDSGGGLKLMNLVGTHDPAQAFHAFGNRPARHHDDFPAIAHQNCQLAAPFTDGLLIQAAAFVGHQAGAYLDHDAFGIAHQC